MRALSPAMDAARLGDLTWTMCWLIVREDGTRIAATSFQADFEYDGDVYIAATGFSRSDHEQKLGFGAGNHDIKGFLDSPLITREDILAEKYYHAMVEVFYLDYTDHSAGKVPVSVGKLGRANLSDNIFLIEYRDLISLYENPIGELHGPYCRAPYLGSPLYDAATGRPGCGVDLVPLTVTGTIVTAGTDRRTFIDSGRAEADGYFNDGVVTFTTGANIGVSRPVKRFLVGGTFESMLPFPYDLTNGDAYDATPGCNKLLKMPGDENGTPYTGDCRAKFNNAKNFVGEPEALGAALVFGGLQ